MEQNFPNPQSNESGFDEIGSPKQITPSQNDEELDRSSPDSYNIDDSRSPSNPDLDYVETF